MLHKVNYPFANGETASDNIRGDDSYLARAQPGDWNSVFPVKVACFSSSPGYRQLALSVMAAQTHCL